MSRNGRRLRVLIRILAVAAGLALLLVAGRSLGTRLPAFTAWVEGLGAWGPVAFIAGYALAVVAFVPGSLLTLAAGAIFGIVRGTLYVAIGATLGETLAFLIARHFARGLIEKRLAGNARFAALDRAIAVDGRRIVLLLRLSPIIPFNLLNYALGLTRVRFADYLIAGIGILPGTLLYVYSGRLVGDVAALAAGGPPVGRGPWYYALLGLGLVATIVATVHVTRIARQALRDATGEGLDATGEKSEARPF